MGSLVLRMCVAVSVVFCAAMLCFADDRQPDDNFFSSTVSSVVDKVKMYTSGEKGLLTTDDTGAGSRREYGSDGLGRKLSEPVNIKTKTVSE